ncbi:MAG: PilZ domain-containing protein [Pseudomonadota bacterium]
MTPGGGSTSGSHEQRSSTRFDCSIPATAYANYTNFFCVVTNISLGGAALFEKGFGTIRVGNRVKLMVEPLDTLAGTVRWVGQTSFGVEFDPSSRTSPRLIALIERLKEATRDKTGT